MGIVVFGNILVLGCVSSIKDQKASISPLSLPGVADEQAAAAYRGKESVAESGGIAETALGEENGFVTKDRFPKEEIIDEISAEPDSTIGESPILEAPGDANEQDEAEFPVPAEEPLIESIAESAVEEPVTIEPAVQPAKPAAEKVAPFEKATRIAPVPGAPETKVMEVVPKVMPEETQGQPREAAYVPEEVAFPSVSREIGQQEDVMERKTAAGSAPETEYEPIMPPEPQAPPARAFPRTTVTEKPEPVMKTEIKAKLERMRKMRTSSDKPAIVKAHTVSSGETLPLLAEKYYGSSEEWLKIYEANSDKIEKGTLRKNEVIIIP
ncbi:MAG: hypothetical protein JW803_07305 [Endomicrobiales bacterium]|nr:hypothetical protein [Endomicrobiales bacterium]